MQAYSDFFRYFRDNGRSHNELWDAALMDNGRSRSELLDTVIILEKYAKNEKIFGILKKN